MNGRLVLAAIGLALVVTGVVIVLVVSVAGIAFVIVGLFPLVMGLSDWHEFEAQLTRAAVKLRVGKQPSSAFEPPRPDIHVLDVRSTGGGGKSLTFRADVVNYGTRQARCTVRAEVDGREVNVGAAGTSRASVDLIPNEPPTSVRIWVPRPELGDLVPEFAKEATLYGRTLKVIASDGEQEASTEWREIIYDENDNAARYEIQQRVWRLGRGEGTDDDARAEAQSDTLRRWEQRQEGP